MIKNTQEQTFGSQQEAQDYCLKCMAMGATKVWYSDRSFMGDNHPERYEVTTEFRYENKPKACEPMVE